MINFRAITEENFDDVIRMKCSDNEHFVASNAYSLAQAWLYREAGDVFPFAIYNDDEPVGFMLLDDGSDEKCLVIWRIMFSMAYQNQGYGTAALRQIIRLAKESGKYDFMILGCAPNNHIAEHVYRKLDFERTGVFSHGEYEMRLDLN